MHCDGARGTFSKGKEGGEVAVTRGADGNQDTVGCAEIMALLNSLKTVKTVLTHRHE